jgi:hypothetical protein
LRLITSAYFPACSLDIARNRDVLVMPVNQPHPRRNRNAG